MLEFHGRVIPTTLGELVHPRQTALLVVDVQNEFCVKGGISYQRGRYLSRGDTVIRKLKSLIQEARKAGVLIVYVQNTTLPNYIGYSAAWLRFTMKHYKSIDGDVWDHPNLIPNITLEGSWGQQIVEEIKPNKEDLVIKKYRSSAFIGTNLDMLLRSNNIKSLLITGVTTEGCVDSTAKDAQFYDYFVVMVRDCVDSASRDRHDAALKLMEVRFDVVNSNQIIAAWKKL